MPPVEDRRTHGVGEGRVRAARLSVGASALSLGLFAVPYVNSTVEYVNSTVDDLAYLVALLLGPVGVASGIRALLSWRPLPTSHRCFAVGGVVAGAYVPLGFLLWLFTPTV